MSCIRELSITIAEEPEEAEDMPLHSAVYDPTRDKIFAVRGGRVFRFHADTLAKETEVQYAGPTFSDSYIAYDAGRDAIWVTYSPHFNAPPSFTAPTNDEYIFKLDPDNLSTLQTVGLGANLIGTGGAEVYSCNNVIRNLIVNGVQLAYVTITPQPSNGSRFVFFNPDSLPGNIFTRSNTAATWGFIQVHPSGSGTDYLYVDDDSYNDGVIRRTNANVFVESSETYPTNGFDSGPSMTARIYGFAYNAANNSHYCANRSNLILKLGAGNNPNIGTAIDLGAVVDVWNIRRNPNNGLLYAPDFIGNQIAVIDPSDDSFVLKAGFDAPWDVVFTASKSIAVQHSAEGLKEIV